MDLGGVRIGGVPPHVHDFDTDRPRITYTHEERPHDLECDVIAGCDGFHGIRRPAIPDGILTPYENDAL